MLINQTNNNGGQVPKLAKICKDVHFNPKTNMWIHHEDGAIYYVYHSIPIIFVNL